MTEPESKRKEIGARIKSLRLSQGIDLETFGKQINPPASASIASRWERGVNMPNNKRLQSIAKLGNVSVDYLLNGSPHTNDSIFKAIEGWQGGDTLTGDDSEKVSEGIVGGQLDEMKNAENAQLINDIQKSVATDVLAGLGTPALRTIKTTVKMVHSAESSGKPGLASSIQTLITLLSMNVNPAIAGNSDAQQQAIDELEEQFSYLIDVLES
ncbi:helix-turn-helix domain-containing protein [Levilactobacillus huananensis]|uniref:helix-turn-helix domain-containing protein n=1 Tax=Levilactobacillus huananensis TaxID=2486019 RepID=UPI0013DDAE25|nr:helix-turn-helix transcriptional regulator [Levilactobacillus huananensis]